MYLVVLNQPSIALLSWCCEYEALHGSWRLLGQLLGGVMAGVVYMVRCPRPRHHHVRWPFRFTDGCPPRLAELCPEEVEYVLDCVSMQSQECEQEHGWHIPKRYDMLRKRNDHVVGHKST